MLGDLICEGKGRTTGQRVLERGETGPRLETSISGEVAIKGNI